MLEKSYIGWDWTLLKGWLKSVPRRIRMETIFMELRYEFHVLKSWRNMSRLSSGPWSTMYRAMEPRLGFKSLTLEE